jgi:hypothetical protein
VRWDAETDRWFEQPDLELPPYTLCVLWTGEAPAAVEPTPRYARLGEVKGPWQTDRGPRAELTDWRTWPRLAEYSGTKRYTRTIQVDDPRGLAIDLGEVGEIAELRVNGKPAGVRIAPPYRWDLAPLAHSGENTIEIDVTNTAQARWKDPFSHGDATSGLLGPVWLLRAGRK